MGDFPLGLTTLVRAISEKNPKEKSLGLNYDSFGHICELRVQIIKNEITEDLEEEMDHL